MYSPSFLRVCVNNRRPKVLLGVCKISPTKKRKLQKNWRTMLVRPVSVVNSSASGHWTLDIKFDKSLRLSCDASRVFLILFVRLCLSDKKARESKLWTTPYKISAHSGSREDRCTSWNSQKLIRSVVTLRKEVRIAKIVRQQFWSQFVASTGKGRDEIVRGIDITTKGIFPVYISSKFRPSFSLVKVFFLNRIEEQNESD